MMEADTKHWRLKGTLLSKNDQPLHHQEGNPTFREYSPSQKRKTKKRKQIASFIIQTKESHTPRTTSAIISLRWNIHTQRRPTEKSPSAQPVCPHLENAYRCKEAKKIPHMTYVENTSSDV